MELRNGCKIENGPRGNPKGRCQTKQIDLRLILISALLSHHIIPPMPGFGAGAGSFEGISVTAHSDVRIREAMLAAF